MPLINRLPAKYLTRQRLPRIAMILLFTVFLFPSIQAPKAQALEVVVEDPELHPTYTTCPQTHWYPFANSRGHTAYLTLNTNNRDHSTNSAEWHPVIPQPGYYRVEAYIAFHAPIKWCNTAQWPIAHDTTEARYTIHHFYGESQRSVSQYPIADQWLDLGEYFFFPGSNGHVSLTDFNGEAEYTTSISFSAMRFTFTRPSRPTVYLPIVHSADPGGAPPPDAGVIQGQGFDTCGLPSLSKMQTWWNASPYSFFGLYLGGIHFPSFCSKADAAWVSSAHTQGWSFIPTWVGPQAPCSGYKHVMNADPAIAYQEGRHEADAASAAAAAVGLTNYGLGGTVIYYDMETFGGASLACRQAAAAFMNGWTERLGELGNLAGGYGARNSYVADWASIEHIPGNVWAASWYADGYDPYASVNGITWLVGLWTNHQRIRQYAGDVSNTWGGVSLAIDINVADGMIAMPAVKSLANPGEIASQNIKDTGWLSAEQGWLVVNDHLYITNNRGADWEDITPAAVQLASLLPSGEAWSLSTASEAVYKLYHSADWGKTWHNLDLPLQQGDWQALQLQFNSSSNGWIVFTKVTSQIFSDGILMKTTDGGLTWQSFALPAGEKVTFNTPNDGWLQDERNGLLYNTVDGGVSWNSEVPSVIHSRPTTYPSGAMTSGWRDDELGWSVTSVGSCAGTKITSGFTCQLDNSLWQTLDGGQNWIKVPIPTGSSLYR
ncbi:MAG: hypothetical protein C3F13_03740 [Anaerolineales bacterium]|nr:MAG: hypothetical protein C3F13_03740 [Anaerolineales bacterium]